VSSYRARLGKRGERLAQEHLRRQGYRILETNFRSREGEIDIVAEKDDWLVFVEVRTRRNAQLGSAEESVTKAKQQRLALLAEGYLQARDSPPPNWRIDVVAIDVAADGSIARLEHIENVTG